MQNEQEAEPGHVHFRFSQADLDRLAARLVGVALDRGAHDVSARAFESDALNVAVRRGCADVVTHARTQGMAINIYRNQGLGVATTTDLSEPALLAAVETAWRMASHTSSDPCHGPADTAWLESSPPPLDLFHPVSPRPGDAIDLAARVESAALAASPDAFQCDASMHIRHQHWALATSRGFAGGYARSLYELGCTAIAKGDDGMQASQWSRRSVAMPDLDPPETIGRRAAERAVALLGARRLQTGAWPVLFEAPVAASLIGSFLATITGQAQYRRQSFLPDSLGHIVLADHVGLYETPHAPRGIASAPFDAEGVRITGGDLVADGVLKRYLLSAYSARKLGMSSSGHADGAHNLTVTSRHASDDDDFAGMLRRLHTGLVVTNLLGRGVNPVTGDYSRGAVGFWVERGMIQFPVHEVTIAGNLKTMLRNIVAVGTDIHEGHIRTGSILIDRMHIAGQ
ncbi:MAG: metalloprotease PmbA [Burkholderia sp.]|jgi:PmbA protein|uniref:metallopeptidase TldD-related protein n=1 Tax=Burkholderia sp. TaxID=36773 RepID=UPI002836B0F3|nr:metallopeptidase TldD-related protein [Burkholderia sp.]MDR0245592.1 metalloprotease PmbA [Burkholderia sp.]